MATNLPAAPAPAPAEAVAPPASAWWRRAARARVPAPAAWSPTAECPVCAEPPSKTPPRPAAVTLAARDAKVKPPPRPRGRARSRPRRSTTQPMSQAPASPASNPDFQAATGQIRVEALRQRTHPLALRRRTEVEKSAKLAVKVQEDQSAKDRNTIKMGKVGAEQLGASRNFSAAGFKADLKKRVESKPPKSEDDAKKLAKSDAVQHFEQDFSKGLATEQGKVTGPLNQQASGDPKKAGFEAGVQAVPIPKPVYPPPPGPVDPSLVVPKPKPDPEVSLQQESDRLSGAMQHNRLSDDQLEQSSEPSFLKTLKAKQDAQQKIGEARIAYRRQEAATLQGATAQANQSLSTSLTGMSRTHTRTGGRVAGGQKDTESNTQKRQREIKQTIDEIYERTAGCVKCTLETLTKKVTEDFTRSLKNETDSFNSRVRDRLDSYYSTGKKVKHFFLGEPKVVVNDDGTTRDLTRDDYEGSLPFLRLKSSIKWINPQVYEIFLEEKDLFIAKMDVQLDAIARDVQTGLTTANNQIQAGKDAVTRYISTLRGDEQRFAKELEQDVLMKFENLEGTIDDAREDLLATLADQYRESINQLETTFNEINDELKKSWLDRAVEFIETVGKTIFQLAELLFSILVRIAYLVWDIIKHPIRFFETLVAGLKQGISDFIGDIGTHLKEAFWTWLTDATPGKTIRLSLGSGVAGLFDLVMQVLNLGPAELRAIVDKILGPEFMQMVDKGVAFAEKAFEPVVILLTKGPVAFWDYVKEQLEEIIQSSFDRIKESVFLAFVKKGILWIAGFFVPGGGFVKIVKAIVRAFQFVAENLERIRRFFDAVFDSMEAATQGNAQGVASKIVTGLKMGIVLALGFLARQLGLNAIIDSVHKILHSLRRPIVNAIEWILRKVKPLVTKIVRGVTRVAGAIVSKLVDWTGLRRVFRTRGGDSHSLFTRVINGRPTLMLATKELTFAEYLASLKVTNEDVEKTLAKQKAVTTFATINTKLAELAAMEAKFGPNPVSAQRGQLNAKLNEIRSEFHVLSEQVTILGIGGSRAETLKTHIAPISGRKLTHLEAKPLTPLRGNTVGNPNPQAEKNVPGWQFLDEINLARNNDKLVYNDWVRWHLIHSGMHGPAAAFNLVAAPRTTNTKFTHHVEQPILNLLAKPGAMLYYKVDVTYGNPSPPLNDFPTSLTYSWGTMKMDTANQPVEVGPAAGSPAKYLRLHAPCDAGSSPHGADRGQTQDVGPGPAD